MPVSNIPIDASYTYIGSDGDSPGMFRSLKPAPAPTKNAWHNFRESLIKETKVDERTDENNPEALDESNAITEVTIDEETKSKRKNNKKKDTKKVKSNANEGLNKDKKIRIKSSNKNNSTIRNDKPEDTDESSQLGYNNEPSPLLSSSSTLVASPVLPSSSLVYLHESLKNSKLPINNNNKKGRPNSRPRTNQVNYTYSSGRYTNERNSSATSSSNTNFSPAYYSTAHTSPRLYMGSPPSGYGMSQGSNSRSGSIPRMPDYPQHQLHYMPVQLPMAMPMMMSNNGQPVMNGSGPIQMQANGVPIQMHLPAQVPMGLPVPVQTQLPMQGQIPVNMQMQVSMQMPMTMQLPPQMPISTNQPMPMAMPVQMGNGYGSPPHMMYSLPSGYNEIVVDKRYEEIETQLRFYFSINNLCKDMYLRGKMDSEGFIDLEIIKDFRRIRVLSDDKVDMVDEVIRNVENVEVVNGEKGLKVRVREGWEKWLVK